MTESSHLDDQGRARMVDVSTKPETARTATAEAFVTMSATTRGAVFAGTLPKGDALALVRVAAVTGAKRTPDLVPLCHPLPLTGVTADIEATPTGARIIVTASTVGRTGVEMEAITGAGIGAITLYDMIKGLDRGAEIGPIRLLSKRGGSSGEWTR
ncbi:MAG: cyclic pyranopterin monophosphate synthase MoaC [Actinomycetota bacterium]